MNVADLAEALSPQPPATPLAPAAGAAAAAAERQTGTYTDQGLARLKSFTVMLVDDDPVMIEIVQAYLEDDGYSSFITTSDPAQAMALMVSKRPDVLLLDLMMPGITGFEILAQVRAQEELRYTPVIILTAESDTGSKLKALELGATDLLTKPVDASELCLRLRNVLAFKAYQDRLADFDPLTGLPNRRKFRTGIDHALTATEQGSRACALLHVDLDRFKQINDTLGHRVGDLVLTATALRLQHMLASTDAEGRPGSRELEFGLVLARIAGNGFGVLVTSVHNLKKVDVATNLARRLLATFDDPFQVDGHELFLTATIGMAVSPGDGRDADALLKHAEMAMYQAKQHGRDTYEFFSGELNAHALERLTLENQLRRAVEREEFVLYYQPKVDIATQTIVGAEALVRWKHPESGIIAPAKFISIAEETNLIVEIGQWALRAACMQVMAWRQIGLPLISVSVNVSGAQFRQGKVWHAVSGALAHSGLPARSLVLELTESMLMENADDGIRLLYELKEMGVRLSVDDFGTGYSSLTYLSRFPMDELKIDRTFVDGLPGRRDSAAIVSAVVALAHGLNLKVVAEGVETRPQLEFLRGRRCDQYQGYLCSRAVPPEPFAQLLRRSSQNAA